MESQAPRKLDAKMPQTTNALHGHKISATQAGVAKSVISRDARTQERGGLCGTEFIRNRSDAARLSDHHLRISTVHRYTQHHRVLAVNRISASARLAHAILAGDQADTNPLPDLPSRHSAAQGFDAPNDFMPGNAGQSQTGICARDGGGIGVTDSACFHADSNLTRSRLRDRPFDHAQNARCGDFHCFVGAFHLSICAFLNLRFEYGCAERVHCRLDATLNPFLFPSIREYRECSSQAERHPPRNARRNALPRDRLRQRLSDPKRCLATRLGFQKVLFNSATACFSMRPLRVNTVNLPRAAVSILKAIDQAISPTPQLDLRRTAVLHPSTGLRQCNRAPICIWLKIGIGREICSDRILGNARIPGVERGDYRKVCFLMSSCLIFKSSVERGIPSLAAAPSGPATFPLLAARAASMSSFS